MDERRKSYRRRTLKSGKVILSDWTVMNCLIRDLSEAGARLEFGALVQLPPEFRLVVDSSSIRMHVALDWQRGLLTGVRFIGPADSAAKHKA
jgi:PilZ domain-containing protein